jgi:hypothetical protein
MNTTSGDHDDCKRIQSIASRIKGVDGVRKFGGVATAEVGVGVAGEGGGGVEMGVGIRDLWMRSSRRNINEKKKKM